MKVFKRPGSRFYAYKFQCRGKEYYRSTRSANRREAEDIAAAARRQILRQAAGLEKPETKAGQAPKREPPSLRQFQSVFNAWVGTAKEEQQGTVKFYRESYQKLLDFELWADLSLDEIDEPKIEAFKAWALRHAGEKTERQIDPKSPKQP